jgi:hypothetical protein
MHVLVLRFLWEKSDLDFSFLVRLHFCRFLATYFLHMLIEIIFAARVIFDTGQFV